MATVVSLGSPGLLSNVQNLLQQKEREVADLRESALQQLEVQV